MKILVVFVVPMVFRDGLILLLGMVPALALPDLEEARTALASPNFADREALTLELWNNGRAALPLLTLLSSSRNPEIANRATFILNRLQMGLGPESPDDLLKLAERADQAEPKTRSARLSDILEHPEGFPVALFFLNKWISDQRTPTDQRISLTETCIEPLLEKRSRWQELLTFPFSPQARAMLIATISIQGMPEGMKARMIAILASEKLNEIHRLLKRDFETLPGETHYALARLAILNDNLALALENLSRCLATSENPDPARAIAFLERVADLAPLPYRGPWLAELQLFRARARMDEKAIIERADAMDARPSLAYESKLIIGKATVHEGQLPSEALLLSALHLSLDSPPGEPDIEALTSSPLPEWPALARTLTALAHPIEAAERLSSEGHPDSAINLLWRTGHRQKALDLAEGIRAGLDRDLHPAVPLTLASLYLKEGEKEAAARAFRTLFMEGIRTQSERSKAIRLARKLLPLEETVPLAPDLTSPELFKRDQAVTPFFDLPPDVASFWYEHLRNTSPPTEPVILIKKIEQLLTENREEAREIIVDRIDEVPTSLLLPSNPLYQNALYLQIPGALEIAIRAAWQQLSTNGLEAIVRSEKWPLEERRRALTEALRLDPANPVLHSLKTQQKEPADSKTILLATLGDPSLALRLGSLTGKRETLATTALVASFSDSATLRCLNTLARSHLRNNDPEKAARDLKAGLLGGIAMGTRPAPAISELVANLIALFQARHLTASTPSTKEIWSQRLRDLGARPLTTE